MRNRVLAVAVATGAAVLCLPGTAQAADPGACTKSHGGPVATVACQGVPPTTVWRATDWCVRYVNGQPFDFFVRGAQVTGNGTSVVACGPGTYATDHVSAEILYDGRPRTPIVGYGGKCLDVKDGKSKKAQPVQMYDCNGTPAQDWTLNADGTISALGKCLNVVWGGKDNGTLVEIYDCVAAPSETWQVRDDRTLVNPASGKCLDVLGFNTANGARPGLWDCNGAENQKWTVTR
ncbi:ricin-type beta-trefoil lectin domain protein [Streptomyces noursei]|uniref:Hydrolase n=1 Tax=Streptomyces noursei TaxID=1971 RepID=A0A059WJF6_STRNR|nr:ricin-type beta-trefoil lectin domain protein [Streptomyces noursei]AIA07977.1 endo-1,3-beta-glucanase [Streptomyces noursei]UWS76298.1 ricin-type beta-trefoil lectin domain protein [Streptomyces noursei]GCB95695.1 hydrolase [Streptomyces noursei]